MIATIFTLISILFFSFSKSAALSLDCDSDLEPPLIDISPLFQADSPNRIQVIDLIGQACEKWGFFQISNHNISSELLNRTYQVMKQFFHQPLEVKTLVKRTEKNSKGYANDELTKQKRDYKEIFDYGNVDMMIDHWDGVNQWPEGQDEFKNTLKEYYDANYDLSKVLISAIAESLRIDRNFFVEHFNNHTSFARLNYYPVLESNSSALGISRHTDAGALTLLWQDSEGLQVYSGTKEDANDGRWVSMKAATQILTVNIGDMIHVWTGGRCRAPEHRVLANPSRERFSIPFFFNPNAESVVKPIPNLERATQKFRPFTWYEFRMKRFQGDYADVGKETQIEDWEII